MVNEADAQNTQKQQGGGFGIFPPTETSQAHLWQIPVRQEAVTSIGVPIRLEPWRFPPRT